MIVLNKKRLLKWASVIILLLLIPLFGTIFSNEVNWDTSDFIIMGSILFGAGLIYELAAQKSKGSEFRFAIGLGLLGAFLLFWVNAAVGIIGNEGQDANLLFGFVFLTLILGTIISRLKAKGMAVTLFIAAFLQILIPVVALIIWPPSSISWAPGVFGVFLLSAFFGLLFLISGVLFKKASTKKELQYQ